MPVLPEKMEGVNYLTNWIQERPITSSAARMGLHLVDRHFTPQWCIQALLNVYSTPPGNILEPARGIDRLLPDLHQHHKSKGQVHASDIADHVLLGNFIGPFYWWQWSGGNRKKFAAIITNPPFTLAKQFVMRSFEMLDPTYGGDVLMLLRLGFLASKRRREFWKKYPLTGLYILSNRPSFRLEGGATDMSEYAWFMWSTRHPMDIAGRVKSVNLPANHTRQIMHIGKDDAEEYQTRLAAQLAQQKVGRGEGQGTHSTRK
jgi:hypothetical protein